MQTVIKSTRKIKKVGYNHINKDVPESMTLVSKKEIEEFQYEIKSGKNPILV